MIGYIIGGILIYLIYRFVTGFVWPVYKATSSMKQQFENMRRQMDQDPAFQHGKKEHTSHIDEKPRFDPGGDYIPFEEVKEK
jgi:hypothetical protein